MYRVNELLVELGLLSINFFTLVDFLEQPHAIRKVRVHCSVRNALGMYST